MSVNKTEEKPIPEYGAKRLPKMSNNTRKLLDYFPKLYRPCESPFADWGFECGNGWFELVYKLSEDLQMKQIREPRFPPPAMD